MFYDLLKTVHVLAVVVWVGGLVFAHFFLRPALTQLDPPQRQRVMHQVLRRFLAAVAWAAGLTLASGLWMLGSAARQAAQAGTGFHVPPGWSVMAVLGMAMGVVFLHVRFAPYRRLGRAVAVQDWPAGAAALEQVRRGVLINLALGVLVLLAALLAAHF